MENSYLKKYHLPNKVSILQKKEKEYLLNKRLLKSVEIDDLNTTKQLINEGATLHKLQGIELHKYNTEHNSLLHTAIKLAHKDIILFLLEIGCDVNSQTRRLRTPLHYATYNNIPLEILKQLTNLGAKIELKDDDNASPFLWACYLNNVNAAQHLLGMGADAHSSDIFGGTPLEWACFQGNLEIITLLVKNIQYSQKQLLSSRHSAIENGHMNIAKFLEKLIEPSYSEKLITETI